MPDDLDLKSLLEQMVKSLVDDPDAVVITGHVGEASAVYEIRVADADVGKALGRKGVYVDALRLLFGASHSKRGKRLHLQVIEPRSR